MANDTKLIDSIKVSNNLLVVLGSETLCRTWCIGAIVPAYRKSIPMQSVIFTNPLQAETICAAAYGFVSRILMGTVFGIVCCFSVGNSI